MKFSNVISHLDGSIWAIEPNKLKAIVNVINVRLSGGKIPEEDVQEAAQSRRPVTRQIKGGRVAVLPVFGTLIQRAGFMEQMSGATDPADISAQFDAFMKDEEVGAIVLQVDSPGGVVFGIQELADKIYNARDKKRIVGVADGYAASAAYKILSAASEVYVSPSSLTGSIGVYQMHIDVSKFEEKEGVKTTLVSAGKYKVEGNPFEPLGEEAAAAIQSEVNVYYDKFVSTVARNRGVSAKEVRNGFGEGRVLTAEKAVSEGLANKVASFEEVISSLVGSESKSNRKTRQSVDSRRKRLGLQENAS